MPSRQLQAKRRNLHSAGAGAKAKKPKTIVATEILKKEAISCPACSNSFEPTRKSQKYCTTACKQLAWRHKKDISQSSTTNDNGNKESESDAQD